MVSLMIFSLVYGIYYPELAGLWDLYNHIVAKSHYKQLLVAPGRRFYCSIPLPIHFSISPVKINVTFSDTGIAQGDIIIVESRVR
jgi:hypothetical protein